VLSSAAERLAWPKRLAGTCRQYSKKAIPQLARITTTSGVVLNFRCPYQAKVMNRFEAVSNTTTVSHAGKALMQVPADARSALCYAAALVLASLRVALASADAER